MGRAPPQRLTGYPFHTWPWLYSWWEYYGENYELRLVTVRDGKLLVGLLPLMLERRGGFVGRLLFINASPSTYQDVRIKRWVGEPSFKCRK